MPRRKHKNQWIGDVLSGVFKAGADIYTSKLEKDRQISDDTNKAILSERENKMKEFAETKIQQDMDNWLTELIQGRTQPVTTYQSKELGGYEIPKTEFKKQPLNPLQQALNYGKLDAGRRYAFNRYEDEVKAKEKEAAKEKEFNYRYEGDKIFKEYTKDKRRELVGDNPFYVPKITTPHWVTNTDGSRTLYGYLDGDPNRKQRLSYQPPGEDIDVDPTSPKFIKQINDISDNIARFEVETQKILSDVNTTDEVRLAQQNALKTKKQNAAQLLYASLPEVGQDIITDYINSRNLPLGKGQRLVPFEQILESFDITDPKEMSIVRALKMWKYLYGDSEETARVIQ